MPQWRCIAVLLACVIVHTVASKSASGHDVAHMKHHEIEEAIQVRKTRLFYAYSLIIETKECSIVRDLNAHRASTVPSAASSYSTRLFALLFPSTKPAVNALLATLYISGPPNFLLALCPPSVDPASLSVMVAFAVGGLLGDTLFHLLPEIFLGEAEGEGVRFVMVDGKRNLLLGLAILVGFVCFVALDKGLQIATGGDAHNHSHRIPTAKEQEPEKRSASNDVTPSTSTSSSALPPPTDHSLRSRTPSKPSPTTSPSITPSHPPKKSPFLPLIADFTHNITDGLALSSSFYASPALGATTCFAVFFHEIPHEVGDFALLIAAGMPKRKAMAMQFVTALGALLGTIIGIAVQEYGGSGGGGGGIEGASAGTELGLLGTGLSWGDLLLPWTAGTFLYVGTVAAIPEMLEPQPGQLNKWREVVNTGKQFLALAVGAGVMLV